MMFGISESKTPKTGRVLYCRFFPWEMIYEIGVMNTGVSSRVQQAFRGELGDISPHAELSSLAKLTANWKSVIEDAGVLPLQKKAEEPTWVKLLSGFRSLGPPTSDLAQSRTEWERLDDKAEQLPGADPC